jgi:membrane protein DedA with SNARE-associated domain
LSLAELVDHYGYVAVLVGTFVEGETILVMGGFAAHQGYLHFPGVVLAAFAGSLSGDQLAFFLGRRYGGLLERFPRLKPQVERATALLRQRGTLLLLGFRFVYGIRNVTPFAAGIARVPIPRFVGLNVAGAVLWSLAISSAGYAFGSAFVLVLERAKRFEEHALIGLAVVGALFAIFRIVRQRAKARE